MTFEDADLARSGEDQAPSLPARILRRAWPILLEAILSLAVLVAAECSLEMFGLFGPPLPFRLNEDGKTMEGNPDWHPLWKTQKSFPERAVFKAQKAPGTFRVFCTGASVAFGLPFKNDVSFSTRLGEKLTQRLPGIPIEVINAAVAGTSSFESVEIAKAALSLEADALVLLEGNNEFLWPYALNTVKRIERPLAWHLDRFRNHFHLCRMFGHLKWSVSYPLLDEFVHMDEFKQEERIADKSWDGGRLSRDYVFEQLAERLDAICSMAKTYHQDRAVPVVLCIPTCNRTMEPRYSIFSPSTPPERQEKWKNVFLKGERHLDAGHPRIALQHFREAEAIDPNPAILKHHIGYALYKLGNYEASKPWFEASVEADDCPLRSTERLRETIRARTRANSALLADLDKAFIEASGELPLDIVNQLLMDGRHMSPTGNRLVAKVVADALANANIPVPLPEWAPDRPPSEEELQRDAELIEENRDWKTKSKQERDAILRLGKALIELVGSHGGPDDGESTGSDIDDYLAACKALEEDYPDFPHGKLGRVILAAWQDEPERARRLLAEMSPLDETVDLIEKAMKNVPELKDAMERAGLLEEARHLQERTVAPQGTSEE